MVIFKMLQQFLFILKIHLLGTIHKAYSLTVYFFIFLLRWIYTKKKLLVILPKKYFWEKSIIEKECFKTNLLYTLLLVESMVQLKGQLIKN